MTNEQAIIELRDLISDDRTDNENEALLLAIEKLREARPQGEWITKGYEPFGRCNICDGICEINNFCGHCGAKMKGRAE